MKLKEYCRRKVMLFGEDILDSVKDELAKQIDDAFSRGINATPSSQIGQDVFIGIKPYSELKKWLLDAGAQRR